MVPRATSLSLALPIQPAGADTQYIQHARTARLQDRCENPLPPHSPQFPPTPLPMPCKSMPQKVLAPPCSALKHTMVNPYTTMEQIFRQSLAGPLPMALPAVLRGVFALALPIHAQPVGLDPGAESRPITLPRSAPSGPPRGPKDGRARFQALIILPDPDY